MVNSTDMLKIGVCIIIAALSVMIFWKLGYVVGDVLGKAIYYIRH